jgi:hypothetical protein
LAAEAASLSRQAIDWCLDHGEVKPELSVDTIFALVPTVVVWEKTPMPLEQWEDNVLHDLCMTTIFPKYDAGFKSQIIGDFSAEMVKGGISQDSGKSPTPQLGDFPTPAGSFTQTG